MSDLPDLLRAVLIFAVIIWVILVVLMVPGFFEGLRAKAKEDRLFYIRQKIAQRGGFTDPSRNKYYLNRKNR